MLDQRDKPLAAGRRVVVATGNMPYLGTIVKITPRRDFTVKNTLASIERYRAQGHLQEAERYQKRYDFLRHWFHIQCENGLRLKVGSSKMMIAVDGEEL